MSLPALHAHRGASHLAPENTLVAFEQAVLEGADAIELDVRASSDGVPVVFHDDELSRMTGVPGRVATTPWAALAKLEVGAHPIPRLADLVPFCHRHRCPLNIELKPSARPAELVAACQETLRALAALVPVLVSSFDPRALALVHRDMPELPLALIFEDLAGLAALAYLPAVDLHPRHDLVDEGTLPRLLDQPRALRVWTVDDAVEAARLIGLAHPTVAGRSAVDALITNRPGPLRRELGATGVS
jgi:glycerophosphoryl diester phosphodiesterase